MTTLDDDNLNLLERLAGGLDASCPVSGPPRSDTPTMDAFMAEVVNMAVKAGLEIKAPEADLPSPEIDEPGFDPGGMA